MKTPEQLVDESGLVWPNGDVECHIDALVQLVRQAQAQARAEQHAKTWTMAMEAAAKCAPAWDSRVVAYHIRSLSCPPINESTEG